MRAIRFQLGLLASVAAHCAAAQTIESLAAISPPAVVVAAAPDASERAVNRQATPTGAELLLYADTLETSRSIRISSSRQLFVRSEVTPRWYRALYGGTQFFVRRADVALLEPAGPGRAGARKAIIRTEK